MWPFRKSAKKQIRDAFSNYLSKEMIDELIRDPSTIKWPELKRTKTVYLIFQIRDDVLDDIAANLARSIEIVIDADGFVDAILSSLVLVTFDFLDDEERAIKLDKRAASIDRLLQELASNIKIIYGLSDALLGPIGAERRFTYGYLVCNLAKSLEALSKLEFGVAAEI